MIGHAKIASDKWALHSLIFNLFTIMRKIFERNSSFHVKQRTKRKYQLPFCRRFLLGLTKFSYYGAIDLYIWALSRSATLEETRIYYAYNHTSLHLWWKENLVEHQKNTVLLFMFLLTTPIIKKFNFLATIFCIFLKKPPRSNVNIFQYQSWTPVKWSEN